MELEKKTKYVNNYLNKYFYRWLIRDIGIILKRMKLEKLEFTLPVILLVCTGIDFSGGLIDGFQQHNVGSRSKKFIKEWMGRINPLYREEATSEVIYDCVRCGSVHQAMYKQGVEIISDYINNNHLCLSKSGNIRLNTYKFADDFIKALRAFRKEYIKNNIENVYQNLNTMVSSTNNSINLLKDILKENKYICKTFYFGTSQAPEPSPAAPSEPEEMI